MISLEQLLALVGMLDDALGENTASARFRRYLSDSITEVGPLRDYLEACLRTPSPQHHRALQDLVNHAGRLVGFDVSFGRYQGSPTEIGHDGLWRLGDYAVVVEIKTTDVYVINTASLVGYVDRLISAKQIPNWDKAIGLYVVARKDALLQQLRNEILIENRLRQLRVATVDSIVSVAELVQDERLSPDEALTLLKPPGVVVDDTVRLLTRIASQAGAVTPESLVDHPPTTPPPPVERPLATRRYVLTPISDREDTSARNQLEKLLGSGWYVFGEKTPLRKHLNIGDRICFYHTGVGVVAEAEVASEPERREVEADRSLFAEFPWAFRVSNVRFFDHPVVIDAELRSQLDAFGNRDPLRSWSWFVQTTRAVTQRDFAHLVGNQGSS